MKIPGIDTENERIIPESDEEFIENPFPGKTLLTPSEAITVINRLSSMLLIDRRYRIGRRGDSNAQHSNHL